MQNFSRKNKQKNNFLIFMMKSIKIIYIINSMLVKFIDSQIVNNLIICTLTNSTEYKVNWN